MEESTTPQQIRVVGQAHDHPAVRRLARACIAVVRWQRGERPAVDDDAAPAVTSATRPEPTS